MILSAAQLLELVALMRARGAAQVEVGTGTSLLRVSLMPHAVPQPMDVPGVLPDGAVLTIQAQGVGRFLLRHPANQDDIAPPGTFVRGGALVALLATGPLLRPVVAPCAGIVQRVLLEPGQIAGYGTPLLEITPNGAAT